MSKFLHFNNLGIPIELIENISDISEIIIQSKKFFKVAQDYDFENNRFRYVLIDGILTELSVSEALTFQSLLSLKRKKENELNNAYNISKVITIQNTYGGKTYSIVIDNNTPEREMFFKKMESATREDIAPNTVITYHQKNNSNIYSFASIPYIWQYIFSKFFLSTRTSGFEQNTRDYNKQLFDEYLIKVQNAKTKAEIENLVFTTTQQLKPDRVYTLKPFHNPTGILLNANTIAEQILADELIPENIKTLITNLTDGEGNIRLINEI